MQSTRTKQQQQQLSHKVKEQEKPKKNVCVSFFLVLLLLFGCGVLLLCVFARRMLFLSFVLVWSFLNHFVFCLFVCLFFCLLLSVIYFVLNTFTCSLQVGCVCPATPHSLFSFFCV